MTVVEAARGDRGPTGPIRLGARTSPLARAQADQVARSLTERGHVCEFVGITTTGDVDQRSLTQIGGTGVFVGAVREALYAGQVDVAVHSLKDLPTAAAPGLEVAACPPREDVRDVLVGRTLATLRDGDRIGTGSPRRAVQLAGLAEQRGIALDVVEIRGNVDTRIGRVADGSVAAVVLAAAGLRRLGRLEDSDKSGDDPMTTIAGLPAQILTVEEMVPAPGQGALALEIHESLPGPLAAAVRGLDDPATRAESLAERAFLATLEAGCTAPVGARAVLESVRGKDLDLTLSVVIGRTVLSNLSESANATSPMRRKLTRTTTDPGRLGDEMAMSVLEELRLPQRARHA